MEKFKNIVLVRANGAGVFVIFQVGADGLTTILASRLCLRFQLRHDSIHVDEDIYDNESGILTHTIGQVSSVVSDNTL